MEQVVISNTNNYLYILLVQLIIVILIVGLICYFYSLSKSDVTYVKSSLNNREYLVQNLENKDEATYMLSVIHDRIIILRDYLKKNRSKYPEFKPYIDQFCRRINKLQLKESSPNGEYTSYTVNKGDAMMLCLRSKDDQQELHDLNLIMYVVIHELAHIACPEEHHTALFKKIFIFLLERAIEVKIYEYVNYSIDPHEYCGLTIDENLLKHKPTSD